MDNDEGLVSLCTLRVGNEVFGFDTAKICEVLGVREVQPVPLAAAFVAGVVPFRGEVLVVLSFRQLLGIAPRGKASNVLVLQDEYAGEMFGLAVDSLGDVLSVDAAGFEENSHTLDAGREALFAGSYGTPGGRVIYLKPELLWPMRLMEHTGQEAGKKICELSLSTTRGFCAND
jgi:purine-binding chemotaxis protein CheW